MIARTKDSFNIPTHIGNGKPWKLQYDINTIQDGNIVEWINANNDLPIPLAYSQAIVTKNRVYLLGGVSKGGVISTVYTAPINDDGTLGSWSNANNDLPELLSNSQAIVTKNRVYLLGGDNCDSYISTVYTAPINSDGTLGAWSNANNDLPIPLAHSQAIVTKNRVYLIGGHSYIGRYYFTSTVYTAPINTDGTLGAWSNANNDLPEPLINSQAIVTKNRVYLLGGYNGSNSHISIVYTAIINDDGTLGEWSNSNNDLPIALDGSQAIVTKNRVYLLGGCNNVNDYIPTVYSASINSDGTLGVWNKDSSSLLEPLVFSQAIITKNRIYLLGGNSYGFTSMIYSALFSGGLNDYSPYYNNNI